MLVVVLSKPYFRGRDSQFAVVVAVKSVGNPVSEISWSVIGAP